jgi:hypothetical protein
VRQWGEVGGRRPLMAWSSVRAAVSRTEGARRRRRCIEDARWWEGEAV